MSTVNTQISDSVNDTLTYVGGSAPSESMGMLDTVMAETVGMLMYYAVNAQTNAQMIGNAAVTATCARMLSVPIPTPVRPTPPPTSPPISPSHFSPPIHQPPVRRDVHAQQHLQELAEAARRAAQP